MRFIPVGKRPRDTTVAVIETTREAVISGSIGRGAVSAVDVDGGGRNRRRCAVVDHPPRKLDHRSERDEKNGLRLVARSGARVEKYSAAETSTITLDCCISVKLKLPDVSVVADLPASLP